MKRSLFLALLVVLAAAGAPGPVAQEPRSRACSVSPPIHGNQVVFTYAGDLYTVAATGGVARRLTSDVGFEMFARFSPDGKWLAFTGPVRRQHRGLRDAVAGRRARSASPGPPRSGATTSPTAWAPTTSSWAGRTTSHVLFRSRRTEWNDFLGKLYLASVERRADRGTAAAARRLRLVLRRRRASSSTTASSASSAPGSATAAGWRTTCGCTTSRRRRRRT